MRWRKTWVIVGIFVVGALVALAVLGPRFDQGSGRLLRPDDAQVVAQGRQVYVGQCAACHGQRLEGQPNWRSVGPDGRFPAPPHDASGHTWHHTDDLLFRITKFGVAKAANLKDHVSAMPAFEGQLSDQEIVAVLSWIKSQWPPEIRDKHNRMNEQARSMASGG
ncbi:MAG: c-type cytochrome, partial [Rubrivivax sp.]|nr:c-type cytochrome [Rubrivivax sp.]